MRRIVFYTTPGCHLCDEAMDLLLDLCDKMSTPPVVEEINILDDPELYARFRHAIPVIALDPDVPGAVLEAPITASVLRQAMARKDAA
jgi:hypothetical protein